jgi:4-alpha-glucanotransferase
MMSELQELAALYGVQTDYHDALGQQCTAPVESLLRVLHVLGAPLAKETDAASALRFRRQQTWRRVAPPVTVAWNGHSPGVTLRFSVQESAAPLACTLELENGELWGWTEKLEELHLLESVEVEGVGYQARRLSLPHMPLGQHRLTLALGGRKWETLVLSAPEQAHVRPGGAKTWGVFAPLYALHSRSSWGSGDFGDLEKLLDWVNGLGGGMVATLPLLAAFLTEPFEPSPYAPASRLFWNELFLDLPAIPEWQRCPEAQRLAASAAFQTELEALRAAPLVDYRRQMALKRQVLDLLARTFFANPGGRLRSLEEFVRQHPRVEDYARFRAAGERQGTSWHVWPVGLREGLIQARDYDESARRYHLYVQWLADEQLGRLAAKARQSGPGLYLDLPLGVHADSYDVWRERTSFALGISGGAPPDPLFTGGQDWGFPPLHPEKIREEGYRYLTACLRRHMQFAGVLRIDHLMGLHRLFWVPHGQGARGGVYVRYQADELYALYCLESHRHGTVLVGEDLGTVPPEVPPAMRRHHLGGLYVGQYEIAPDRHPVLSPVRPGALACLNTHDMPPFAAFWHGLDIDDRLALGLLDADTVRREHAHRRELCQALVRSLQAEGYLGADTDLPAVVRGLLAYLANGASELVLVNLEDLWQETQQQNVPGTWHERPNWQQKARHALETITGMEQVLAVLQAVDGCCKGLARPGSELLTRVLRKDRGEAFAGGAGPRSGAGAGGVAGTAGVRSAAGGRQSPPEDKPEQLNEV